MGMVVTVSVGLSSAGTVSMEMSSIMRLAMSFAGMDETSVSMSVMTETESTLMDVMSIVSRNSKGLRLLAKELSFQ